MTIHGRYPKDVFPRSIDRYLILLLLILFFACPLGCSTLTAKNTHELNSNIKTTKEIKTIQNSYQGELNIPESIRNTIFPFDLPVSYTSTKSKNFYSLYSLWLGLFDKGMNVFKYDYIEKHALFPKNSEFFFKRGLTLDILNFHDLAIWEYTVAIDLNPNCAKCFNNRGAIYMIEGYTYLAVEDFKKAIEIDPTRPEHYLNRGKALKMMGDFRGAKEDFDKAVELGICDKYPTLLICK